MCHPHPLLQPPRNLDCSQKVAFVDQLLAAKAASGKTFGTSCSPKALPELCDESGFTMLASPLPLQTTLRLSAGACMPYWEEGGSDRWQLSRARWVAGND